MAIDFTHRSRFNEEANFTMVRWGADSPVPEVELNEMQDISEGKLRDVVKATFGNGLLGVGAIEYDEWNKTLIITNEKAFVEGYLLNIERLEARVTKDVPVRLNCWKEVITSESKIYKHGNMQAGFIPNTLIDERYGKEITRREQIVFNLESDDNPDTHKSKGYSLEIGSLRDLINKETGEQYVGFDIVAEKASVDAASIGKTFCFSKDTPETDEEEYLWFKQLESDEGIPTENVKEFDMVLLKVNQKEGTTEVYYPKVKWSSIIDLPDNIVYSREVADTEIPSPVNINNIGLEIGMFSVTYGIGVPAGYVEANGQEINRIAYADLFEYAWQNGLIISEDAWQEKFTAQGGLVTEYGYADGSAMFRVPRIIGDSSLSEKRIIKAFGTKISDGVVEYQDVIEALKGYLPLHGTADKAISDGNGNEISDTYLPLSGGVMTGNILYQDNPGQLSIVAGTDVKYGAALLLNNKDNTGMAFLRSRDNEQGCQIQLSPNGEMYIQKFDGDTTNVKTTYDIKNSAIVAKSLGTNGYVKYASGLIIQWGTVLCNGGSTVTKVTLPLSFPANEYRTIICPMCTNEEITVRPAAAFDTNRTYDTFNIISANRTYVEYIAIGR